MFRRLWSTQPFSIDIGLLLLRIALAVLMMPHGWGKLMDFAERSHRFPDPLGVGNETSMGLVIFAEFFCSVLLFFGLFTRFALIPLIGTMTVAVLVIHGNDPMEDKEHALLFLLPFTGLFFMGEGKWSLDRLLKK